MRTVTLQYMIHFVVVKADNAGNDPEKYTFRHPYTVKLGYNERIFRAYWTFYYIDLYGYNELRL